MTQNYDTTGARTAGPVFLIGYMGCGKSTLGRTVAELLPEVSFIDLDAYITDKAGCTVADYFARHGEESFRVLERDALHEVTLANPDAIIACGGGTPCFFDNMEWMNAHGTTVLLEADVEALHRRLMRKRYRRPLIAALNDDELRRFIVTTLEQRRPFYSRAQLTFGSDLLESEAEKADTARRFIKFIGLR